MSYEYWVNVDVLNDDGTTWKYLSVGRSVRESAEKLAEDLFVSFKEIGLRAQIRVRRSTDVLLSLTTD